jgi:hypothetical protein
MQLRNSITTVLTLMTLLNSSSLHVRTYAHKKKKCLIASNASEDAFAFPSVHGYLTIGGVQ